MTEPYYCINCGAEATRNHEGVVKHVRNLARACDLDDEFSIVAEIND